MSLPWNAEELEGSPVLEADDEGVTATRVFRVPNWSDWKPFAAALLGRYALLGGSVVYEAPAVFPGFANLFVSRIRVEPFDPGNPRGFPTLQTATNAYPAAGARVTAEYQTAYDIESIRRTKLPSTPPGTFLTYQANVGVEFDSTPARLWEWDDGVGGPLPDDLRPQVVRPHGVHVVTWHRVLQPPFEAITRLRGKVNSTPFLGAPAGAVLFAGAHITRQFHFAEDGGFWRLRYTFIESTKSLAQSDSVGGWNHFPKRIQGGSELWTPIKAAGSIPARPLYMSADMLELFTPE